MFNKHVLNEHIKTCQTSFSKAALILLLPQAGILFPFLFSAVQCSVSTFNHSFLSLASYLTPSPPWSRSLEGQPCLLQGQTQWSFLGLGCCWLISRFGSEEPSWDASCECGPSKLSPLLFYAFLFCLCKYVFFLCIPQVSVLRVLLSTLSPLYIKGGIYCSVFIKGLSLRWCIWESEQQLHRW